ncbi:hypothetical protein HDU86_005922 [Geranomyces michiganensis]|nr:hypothetical protein HDU86_005922 [Geranomyces michiganensis]
MLEDDPLFPVEGKVVHGLYLFLGLFVIVFSLLALLIKERLYLSEALVATALGIAFGPVGLDPFGASTFAKGDLDGSNTHIVLLEVTRFVLVVQCMAAGVSLPGNYVRREWLSLFTLLGPIMICMWLISALGLYLILGLSITDALVIASCITPTDPILANSIVQGKFAERHIPVPVRQLLSAESAANDGLGLPFLLLPLFITEYHSVGAGIGAFIWKVVLYQVVLSVILGALIGYAAQRALKYAERRNLVDKESMLSFSIALGIMIMGGMTLLGTDDILASFVAGTVLTWDHWFNKQFAESHFQESIDLLLNLATYRSWRNAGNGTRSAVRAAIANTPAPPRSSSDAENTSHTVNIPNEIHSGGENELGGDDHLEMKVNAADATAEQAKV